MALSWDEVTLSPGFKSLDDDQKEQARQQYFTEVVAPQVPSEHLESARAQFDGDTNRELEIERYKQAGGGYGTSFERGLRRLHQGLAGAGAALGNALIDDEGWFDTSRAGRWLKDQARGDEQTVAEHQQAINALPVHPAMRRAYEAANREESFLDASGAALGEIADSPDTFGAVTEQLAELGPQMLTFAGGAGLAGRVLPGMMTGLPRHAAQMGIGGGLSSVANTYGPNLGEGLDRGLSFEEAQDRAMLQSAAQGAVDAATGALLPVKIGGKWTNLAAQTGAQMAGGGLGEVARSAVVGEEVPMGDVAMETWLEALGMPADIATTALTRPQGVDTVPQAEPPTDQSQELSEAPADFPVEQTAIEPPLELPPEVDPSYRPTQEQLLQDIHRQRVNQDYDAAIAQRQAQEQAARDAAFDRQRQDAVAEQAAMADHAVRSSIEQDRQPTAMELALRQAQQAQQSTKYPISAQQAAKSGTPIAEAPPQDYTLPASGKPFKTEKQARNYITLNKKRLAGYAPVEFEPGKWAVRKAEENVKNAAQPIDVPRETIQQSPALNQVEPYSGPDRRKDTETRKRVSEMTPEEMQKALLTSDLTGLPNRRAYEEAVKKPVQISIDADALKWFNDNMGPKSGDALLQAVGQALADESPDVWHFSGDEFMGQADTEEQAHEIMGRVINDRLRDATVIAIRPDGKKYTKKGLEITYGLGPDKETADFNLKQIKQQREDAGLRAKRGEQPQGVAIESPEGNKIQSGVAAEATRQVTQEKPAQQTPPTSSVSASTDPVLSSALSFAKGSKDKYQSYLRGRLPKSKRDAMAGEVERAWNEAHKPVEKSRTKVEPESSLAATDESQGERIPFNKEKRAIYSKKLKPVLNLDKSRTGWSEIQHDNGSTLVHPHEDYALKFQSKNERSGTDALRAKAQAQAFAIDNPVAPRETPKGELDVRPMFAPNKEPQDESGQDQEQLAQEGGEAADAGAQEKTLKNKQERLSARKRRGPSKSINAEVDDILSAIAKSGGISRAEAKAQGIDPAHFRMRGHGISYVFTNKGDSFDGMAERLYQLGYPVKNAEGQYDANEMLNALDRALAGNKVMSQAGVEKLAEKLAAERDQAQQEQQDQYFDEQLQKFDTIPTEKQPSPEFEQKLDELAYLAEKRNLNELESHLAELRARAKDALGEDETDAILERVSQQTEDLSDEEYHQAVIRELEQAINRPKVQGNAGDEQGVQGGIGRGENAGVQAQAKGQVDFLGKNDTAQALKDREVARQQKERNAPDMEEGAGDLFTRRSKQVDIEDVAKKAEPPKEETTTPARGFIESYKDFDKRVDDGDVTLDEFKAKFNEVLNGKERVFKELSAKTKDKLFDEYPGLKYRYKNEPKQELIDAVYRDMLRGFTLSSTLSYNPMEKNGAEKAVRKAVDGVTEETLKKHAADVLAAKKELEERTKEAEVGMENPQSIDDFQRILHAKANKIAQEGGKVTYGELRMMLTPEQREKFDDLTATKSRGERVSKKASDRTTVSAAGATTGAEIITTKHTRDGYDLFVVKPAERVERDVYNDWNSTAKKLGGWYSAFKGNGAVPGFQFKTRESAEAFQKYVSAGDTEAVQQQAQTRRDEFADDRSQTAVERLTEMADKLDERADESLNQDRKANTARRARMAASAEADANYQKSLAATMRNIAQAISDGKAKYLDQVRQKVQVEMLNRFLSRAKYDELRAKYPTYSEQEKHKGESPTKETVDHAEFPQYTAYRSDLASLGRELLEHDGLKKIGQSILKIADDVTDTYTKWAKDNLNKITPYRVADGTGLPGYHTSAAAEAAIARSGFNGKAIPLQIKRGNYTIVMSPSEAVRTGAWEGDNDKRVTLTADSGAEIVEKAGRRKLRVPHVFESTYEQRKRLAAMGIETPAEFRAALREFVSLREAPKQADKIKEMERAMIGRKNDGLDFFPTPVSTADAMIEAADIKEGMSVLEPSAGMGHIADRIREAGFEPDVIELSGDRRELLEAKGYAVAGTNFMDAEGKYDRIIMNPPFSDRRDMQHVQHAYDMLKPGGRLVALMGEGVFFGSDKKATEFREWLESVGGTDEKLEEGTFKDASLPVNTGVNARMIVVDKPESASEAPRFSKGQQSTGITRTEATSRLSNLLGSRTAQALLDSGRVVLVEDEGKLPGGGKSIGKDRTLGVTIDGKMYLNLAALDTKSFDGVALHEGAHAALKATVGEADYDRLMRRMENLRKLSKGGTGEVGKFFKQALAAIPSDTKAEHLAEELAAYSVERYTNAPQSLPQTIAKWIKDFLAAIRVGLMRALPQGSKLRNKLLDSASEADLARLAIVGLKRAAKGEALAKSNGVRYSKRTATAGDITDDTSDDGKKNLRASYKKYTGKLIDAIDHWTSPISGLPQALKFENFRNLAQGETAKWDESAAQVHKLFNKASEQDQKAIYDYLTTKGAVLNAISKPLRAEAMRVKTLISDIGKMLVDRGVIPEESRLKYEDAYLPQVYFAYLLGDEAVRTTAGGKKISGQGYAKARKYIDKSTDREIRDVFLGEIKDPGYLAARAIAIPMRDLAMINWLEQIAANPEWVLPEQMVDWTPPWGGDQRQYSAKELRDLAAKVKAFAEEQSDANDKKKAMDIHEEIRAKAKEADDSGMVFWNPRADLERYIYKSRKVTPFWLKSQAESLRKRAAAYQEEVHKEAAYKLANRMDEEANKVLDKIGVDKEAVPKGYKRMPDSPRYGALRGLIVREAIHDDIAGISDIIPQDAPWIQQFLGYGGTGTKITQIWKWAKVAANPPGQVRNFISNMIMLNLSGIRPDRIVTYFTKAVRQIHNNGEYYKMYRKHGLQSSTFAASEFLNIEQHLVDLERQARKGFGIHTFKRMGALLMDKTGKAYQWSESVAKLMKMMHEMEVNKLSEEQAVHEANKWTFDYTEVNPTIRYLRNAPIGVPFATYAVKVLPRLLEVASQHPLRLLPYAAVLMGLPMWIAAQYGVDDDDLDKLRKALPEWLEKRGNTLPLPYKDAQGRWQFVDVGYFLPWSQYWDMAKAVKDADAGELFSRTGALAGPFPSVIAAVTTGNDPFTDRPIINEYDPAEKKFVAIMQYVYGLMAPPWLVGVPVAGVQPTFKGFAGHAYDALTGHVDKYGDPTSTGGQAALRFFGVNAYAVEPRRTRAERLRRMRFEISQVKRRMMEVLRDRNLTPGDRKKVIAQYKEEMNNRIKQMAEYQKESQINPALLQ